MRACLEEERQLVAKFEAEMRASCEYCAKFTTILHIIRRPLWNDRRMV